MILSALRRIYKGDIDLLHDIEENLFNENWRILNQAATKGFVPHNPDDDFFEIIKSNNAVFSAFKVHRLQNDIAAQLLDAKGDLKPFEKFATDVQTITDHGCKRWLRTEYDTAVIRSHKAAQWQQFLREADILPNIKWLPTTSLNPREEHMAFWGLILPIGHSFWLEHQPGDVWNCKCDWTATDEEPTMLPTGWKQKAIPSKGLDENPGVTGKLFSNNHPYIAKGHNGSKEAVNKFISTLLKEQAQKNISELKSYIDSFNGYDIMKKDFINGKLVILRKSFKSILEHGGDSDNIKRLLVNLKFSDMLKLKYIGWANIATNHLESKYVTYYEYRRFGKTYYFIMRMHNDYKCEVLHAIKMKYPNDIILGKP